MKRILMVIFVGICTLSLVACQTNGKVSQDRTRFLVVLDPSRQEIVKAGQTISKELSADLVELGEGNEVQIDQYEYIFLGFSTQDNALPDSVQDFLDTYDLGARTIYPFVYGKENEENQLFEEISQREPGALMGQSALIFSKEPSSATIQDWIDHLSLDYSVSQGENQTVSSANVSSDQQQVFYLWDKDDMPSLTQYTEDDGDYFDDPDFRPYVTSFPVPQGVTVKGAVLICAGGAFQFRSDQNEGTPVAQALSQLGYQSFVVDYRLRPYTQQEGALDLARAVRFVRLHAQEYGIDPQDIAVMGFSAGGILSGEMLLNFDGSVLPSVLDPTYRPDSLDEISADVAACGMIYSFYGRLSVATRDVGLFRSGDLPPTFYCYGTRDPFYDQFLANAQAAREAGVQVEQVQLEGHPHGFGVQGDWISQYDEWLSSIFSRNDW